MTLGIHQDLVLMLAVQLYEPVRKLPQRSGRNERAIHERTATALCRDFAPQHHLHVAILELRLHLSDVLTGAHQVAGSPAAKQEPDGLD